MKYKVSVMPGQEGSWEQLLTFLPKGWREKCFELGAIRRQREFSDAAVLLRTLLIHVLDGCSLRETKMRAKMANLADVSDVALMKRLSCSGEWFRWMATELLGDWVSRVKSVLPLNVQIVDATHVNEPGSTGTDWRIHYAFDLGRLECSEMRVTDHTGGETFKNFTIEKGVVYSGDRGYFHPGGIEHVVSGDGHVLVRMTASGPKLYDLHGKDFKLFKNLRKLKGNKIGDWDVFFKGTRGKVFGRVCAIRKSDVATQRTLAKIHHECARKGKKPSKAALEAAGYVFVFTTVPRSLLTTGGALELYRDRWQIELVFKRMKSILGLGHLPKKDPVGAKAWIHGKLFCASLIEAVIRAAEAFSPWGYPLETTAAA